MKSTDAAEKNRTARCRHCLEPVRYEHEELVASRTHGWYPVNPDGSPHDCHQGKTAESIRNHLARK